MRTHEFHEFLFSININLAGVFIAISFEYNPETSKRLNDLFSFLFNVLNKKNNIFSDTDVFFFCQKF